MITSEFTQRRLTSLARKFPTTDVGRTAKDKNHLTGGDTGYQTRDTRIKHRTSVGENMVLENPGASLVENVGRAAKFVGILSA